MTRSQKLTVRLSEVRQRLNELLGVEDRSDEQNAELETLTGEAQKLEPELRAAIVAEGDPTETRTAHDRRRRGPGAARAARQGGARGLHRGGRGAG